MRAWSEERVKSNAKEDLGVWCTDIKNDARDMSRGCPGYSANVS